MPNPLTFNFPRVPASTRRVVAILGALCALSACSAGGRDGAALAVASQAAVAPAPPAAPVASPHTDVMQPATPLAGAGAAAFDADGTRIAWSTGSNVRIRELPGGTDAALAAGAAVSDLGYAPDGALWTVGGDVSRWRDGKRACTAQVDADRLLALDAQGVVVAGYTQGDGVGMLRRQAWLDNDCRIARERTDPLPATVADAESDPGAPLQRASLRPPREVEGEEAPLPEGARVIASSADGRYRVIDLAGQRQLQDTGAKPAPVTTPR